MALMFDYLNDLRDWEMMYVPRVRRILFNDPATVVFWADGTKTVVKTTEGDKYIPYYGFLAALAKKVYGSNRVVQEMIQPWLPKEEPAEPPKMEVKKSKYCDMPNGCMFCDNIFCAGREKKPAQVEKKCEDCGKCKKKEEVIKKADEDGDELLDDLFSKLFTLAILDDLKERMNEKIGKHPAH